MDRHELNEMFDALAPGPGRERELLEKLLQDDARRNKPMKNWKRIVLGAAAAALLVTAATAAVAPGLSRKLLDYLGVGQENTQAVELLAPGAMAVDITKEDNGAVLHVTQVLRDRTSIIVLADFTAPEGTVLDMGDFDDPACWRPKGFISKERIWPYFINEAGERLDGMAYGSYHWEVLDHQDDRCSMIFQFETHSYEGMRQEDAAAMWVPAMNLHYFVGGDVENGTFLTGDWSFEIPLPQEDIGYTWQVNQVITELDGANIRLQQVYLSPMKLRMVLSREGSPRELWEEEMDVRNHWSVFPRTATLTAKDGETVRLETRGSGGGTDSETVVQFIIKDFIDASKFQGGTLTLEWEAETGEIDSASFPLDDLMPVEP